MSTTQILEYLNMELGRYLLLIFSFTFLALLARPVYLKDYFKSLSSLRPHHFKKISFVFLILSAFGPVVLYLSAMFMTRQKSIVSFNIGVVLSCIFLSNIIKYFELKQIRFAYYKYGDMILKLPMPVLYFVCKSPAVSIVYYSLSMLFFFDVVFSRVAIAAALETFKLSPNQMALVFFAFVTVTTLCSYLFADKVNDEFLVLPIILFVGLVVINLDKKAFMTCFVNGEWDWKSFLIGLTIGFQIADIFCFFTTLVFIYGLQKGTIKDSLFSSSALSLGLFPALSYMLISPLAYKQLMNGSSLFGINSHTYFLHILTVASSLIVVWGSCYCITLANIRLLKSLCLETGMKVMFKPFIICSMFIQLYSYTGPKLTTLLDGSYALFSLFQIITCASGIYVFIKYGTKILEVKEEDMDALPDQKKKK